MADALGAEARERRPAGRWAMAGRMTCAVALLTVALRLGVADRALELCRRSAGSGAVAEAAARYRAYDAWRLPGTSADLWYSRAMSEAARNTPDPLSRLTASMEAGGAALRATRTAEEPFNAWYRAAQLYASQNDPAHAESSLRNAIAAYPGWFKPHWTLARLLQLENRREEAQHEAALAARLNGGKDSEVSDTLRDVLEK